MVCPNPPDPHPLPPTVWHPDFLFFSLILKKNLVKNVLKQIWGINYVIIFPADQL